MSATQENLLSPEVYEELPELAFTEDSQGPLLEGSQAYCGFEHEGMLGEVYCGEIGAGTLGNPMDIVFHGSEDRETVVIGIDQDEMYEAWRKHGGDRDRAVQFLILRAQQKL